MGRSPCCEKEGLKKGPWTPEEDQKLLAYIELHGHGCWRSLPEKAGLQRCGKSCRLRWTNYLRPDIKRGKFSLQEEQTIIQLHAFLGNRWSAIATHIPKRTDNEIKNYWNTHLKKRLTKMGINPVTHKPWADGLGSATSTSEAHTKAAAQLSHTAQWESARLEAEARLAQESKLRSLVSAWPINTNTAQPNLDSPTSTLGFSENLSVFQSMQWHEEAANAGFEAGFTGLLVDESGNPNTKQQEGVQEEEEEDKSYWSNILYMVNSSLSSSSSPSVVTEYSPGVLRRGEEST